MSKIYKTSQRKEELNTGSQQQQQKNCNKQYDKLQ